MSKDEESILDEEGRTGVIWDDENWCGWGDDEENDEEGEGLSGGAER